MLIQWVDGCCICCSMTVFSSSRFSYQISGSRSCLNACNRPLPTFSFRCRKLICLDPNHVGVSVWVSADSTNLNCFGLCDIHDSERRSPQASVCNEQISAHTRLECPPSAIPSLHIRQPSHNLACAQTCHCHRWLALWLSVTRWIGEEGTLNRAQSRKSI